MSEQPTKLASPAAGLKPSEGKVGYRRLLAVELLNDNEPQILSLEQLHEMGFDGCEFYRSIREPLPVTDQIEFVARTIPTSDSLIHATTLRFFECDISRAVGDLKDAVLRLGPVGIQFINIVIPPLVARGPNAPSFARYQDAFNFAYALLRQVRLEAEAAGTKIGLVAGAHGCFTSPIELRELIDCIGSCNVGACFDETFINQGPSLWDWLTTLTHRTKSLRLNFARTSLNVRVNTKSRSARFEYCVETLNAIKFDGALVHIPEIVARI